MRAENGDKIICNYCGKEIKEDEAMTGHEIFSVNHYHLLTCYKGQKIVNINDKASVLREMLSSIDVEVSC